MHYLCTSIWENLFLHPTISLLATSRKPSVSSRKDWSVATELRCC